MFTLVTDKWTPAVVYCNEPDAPPGYGLLIYTHSHGMAADGPLVKFDDDEGAPVNVGADELFVGARQHPGVIYAVPDTCVFRLATSPLQVVRMTDSGEVVSEPPERVASKYLPRSTFRKVDIAVRDRH